MPVIQDERFISITTPLGPDVLLLEGIAGTEGISTLFHFDLQLISESHDIAFEDIVGTNVTICIDLADGNQRFFNGIIASFSQNKTGGESGQDARFSYYSAVLVPELWLFTRTSDLRIFQEMSVPDIIEKVFQEKGFSNYALRLNDSYESKTYCVQYRETDFNFISRLMEEEGIYYFFEHEDGNHTLVLADTPSEHRPCPFQESAACQPTAGAPLDYDVITGIEITREIKPGKYTLKDYNFETPSTDLTVEASARINLGPHEREIYEYPAEYYQRSAGDRLVNIRMQEEEAGVTTITGESNCRAFTAGFKFTLEDVYREDMNDKDYVLISIHHSATQVGYATGDHGESSMEYQNTFVCIPHEVPFRPRRTTPKPIVEGVQTAIVVGPPGEEIYTDEHGRVKVQFHWDREGKRDDRSSCWIRVSQPWAGAGWGGVFIPRIGHEVIVDFIEGDPDRPIITGRVYHGNNRPPYGLPDYKTISTIKSDSSKGGGGYNELRFDDNAGNEQIYLHAQGCRDTIVNGSWRETVGGELHQAVKQNKIIKVDGSFVNNIGQNFCSLVEGDYYQGICGLFNTMFQADTYFSAREMMQIASRTNLVLYGGRSITLKCDDSNFITIDSSGVTIVGTQVKINSGGSATHSTPPDMQFGIQPTEASSGRPPQESAPGERQVTQSSHGTQSFSSTVTPSASGATPSSSSTQNATHAMGSDTGLQGEKKGT